MGSMGKSVMMKEYYKEKLAQGEQYQAFIQDVFDSHLGIKFTCFDTKDEQYNIGESKAGIEIKFDSRISETNNLYIETEEKSHKNKNNYSPSGIYRSDNTWLYVIGDYKKIFLLSKMKLVRISHLLDNGKYSFRNVITDTSKGFLIPIKEACNIAEKVIDIKEKRI